jgi:hypothetical protein
VPEAPEIELLWWSECPSWRRTLAELREEMEALGLDPGAVAVREIETDAEAIRESFMGSPTIRVDGEDVDPPEPEQPFGLACRVYRRPDGRVSPLPDREDVRAALSRAMTSTKQGD